MNNLPPHVVEKIMGSLGGKSLARMRATSKTYRRIINTHPNLTTQRATYKRNQMNKNVKKYKAGNRTALNKWSIPNLAWWAKHTNWMNYGLGAPFIKRGGRWVNRRNLQPVTKQNVLDLIRTLRNNL